MKNHSMAAKGLIRLTYRTLLRRGYGLFADHPEQFIIRNNMIIIFAFARICRIRTTVIKYVR